MEQQMFFSDRIKQMSMGTLHVAQQASMGLLFFKTALLCRASVETGITKTLRLI